jgi:AraC-like DNA-binding protein
MQSAARDPLLKNLFPTHVGYFPNAKQHWITRPEGTDETIFKYCVKGAGVSIIEGRRSEVSPGELLVVPEGVPHAYGASEARPWTIHWFHARGEHMDLLRRKLGVTRERPVTYLGIDAQLIELFQELRLTLEEDCSPPHLLYAAQVLSHLVGRMIRRRMQDYRNVPDSGDRVLKSVEYIKQHLEDAPRVETLASIANLSPSRYSALFRQLMGCSPKSYTNRLRLRRATQLLANTEFTIQTVAQMLGSSDPLYFSRWFRDGIGLSPSEYRNEKQRRTVRRTPSRKLV